MRTRTKIRTKTTIGYSDGNDGLVLRDKIDKDDIRWKRDNGSAEAREYIETL